MRGVLHEVGELAGAFAEYGPHAGVDGVGGDDVDDLGAAGLGEVAFGAVFGLQGVDERPRPLQEDERAGGRQGDAFAAGRGGGADQVELAGLERGDRRGALPGVWPPIT
jgi:hypothetical protein